MMPDSWRATFESHARTQQFARSISDTRRAIWNIKLRPSVAFSGGKDSVAMLALVAERWPEVSVVHWDFGRPANKAHNSYPEDMETEILTLAKRGTWGPVVVGTKHKYWRSEKQAKKGRPIGVRVEFVDAMRWQDGSNVIAKQLGCECVCVGLRASESVRRRHRVASNIVATTVMPEVWPIAKMSEMDVWGLIVSRKLPYLSLYDKLAKINPDGYIGLRTTSLFRDPMEAAVLSGTDALTHWRNRHSCDGGEE